MADLLWRAHIEALSHADHVRLLVCGSRTWTDAPRIIAELSLVALVVPFRLTVIHGDCPRGADALADAAAQDLGLRRERYTVDNVLDGPWPMAGCNRNARMLRDGKPTAGLAFGDLRKPDPKRPVRRYTGTGDMVRKMRKAGLTVRWTATPDAEAVILAPLPAITAIDPEPDVLFRRSP